MRLFDLCRRSTKKRAVASISDVSLSAVVTLVQTHHFIVGEVQRASKKYSQSLCD